MKTFKRRLLASSFLLLALAPMHGFAGDAAEQAFEEGGISLDSRLGKGLTGTAVAAGGAGLVLAGSGEMANAYDLIGDERASVRRTAADQVAAKHPDFQKIIKNQRTLEVIDNMPDSLKPTYAAQRAKVAGELAAMGDKVKEVNRLIDLRQINLMESMNVAGKFERPITPYQSMTKKLVKGKMMAGSSMIVGLSLIAAGGMRLGEALTHSDSGVGAVITGPASSHKALPTKANAQEKAGGNAGMSVE